MRRISSSLTSTFRILLSHNYLSTGYPKKMSMCATQCMPTSPPSFIFYGIIPVIIVGHQMESLLFRFGCDISFSSGSVELTCMIQAVDFVMTGSDDTNGIMMTASNVQLFIQFVIVCCIREFPHLFVGIIILQYYDHHHLPVVQKILYH